MDSLTMLAHGARPEDGLVQPCRLWAGGSEYYGEEAIVAAFGDDPLTSPHEWEMVAGATSLALFSGEHALIADIDEAAITRIWRLGPGPVPTAERAISVPFDTDLAQARGDVFHAASDHPNVDPAMLDRLVAEGRVLARGNHWHGGRLHRCRAFLIRAFDDRAESVGLFALHLIGGDAVRWAGFSFAAIRVRADSDVRIYRDMAGDSAASLRPWRPRID